MTAVGMIDLRQPQDASRDTAEGLSACLAPLIGEPFRFARVSYGDELTLHFGDLRPARSPKLKDKTYGSYVLGVRASLWLLKSGAEPIVVASGIAPAAPPAGPALAQRRTGTGEPHRAEKPCALRHAVRGKVRRTLRA
jgi:hypothetical protein